MCISPTQNELEQKNNSNNDDSDDDNSTRNSKINHKSSSNIKTSFIFSHHLVARLGSIAPAMPLQCHLCYGKGSRRWATWTT